MKGNIPHSRAPAVPASTGFRCTPTPGSRRIGATSGNASSAIPPEAPYRWNAFPRIQTATSLVTLRKTRGRHRLFSQPWGGFSDFQDDSAIAVEPVQEIARTNGPEMVQKRFGFRQDA